MQPLTLYDKAIWNERRNGDRARRSAAAADRRDAEIMDAWFKAMLRGASPADVVRTVSDLERD